MIFEHEKSSIQQQQVQDKLAIVGMDAFFGNCNGLDAFERSIYDGVQHFIPLPPQRWYGIEEQENLLKEYGLPDGKAPVGAYIKEFEIDALACKIPPNEVEKLNPQQLLLLEVANRALKDAGLREGGNVAVIIAAETEFSVHQLQQRWDLSWQIKDGLNAGEICLPAEKIAQLETIVKDGIHHQVEIGEYMSYIANIMASRISSLWDFTGPTFAITAGENSTFKALELAQMLLGFGEVDAVVVGAVDLAGGVENVLVRSQWAKINTGVHTLSYDQKVNGSSVGEGAGVVILKRYDTAQQEGDRIYAVIDAISFAQSNNGLSSSNAAAVKQVCNQAFNTAGIKSTDVNYVEVFGSGVPQEDEAEIQGLLAAYHNSENTLDCAIGSVKANIGHTYVASGIASLIKTALCVYHRYIPATPKWTGVKNPQMWEKSRFYVAGESIPWFPNNDNTKRIAAINGMGIDGTYAHLILSEELNQKQRRSNYLQQKPYYLFPLAASTHEKLLELIDVLENTIENCSSLSVAAASCFATFKQHQEAKYALAIVGHNKKELAKEIQAARKGVNNAFEKGEDWQTPLGSYFTAKPLGKEGAIAYLYPAAVNSYVGIGRNLFRLFPKVYDDFIFNSLYSRASDIQRLVYPRSLNKFSIKQQEALEKQLLDDSSAMLESEIAYARLITTIIRDDFQVQPKFVFGYSLGETSMMVAHGVWSNFYQGSNTFNSSSLFAERLSGSKHAVREYWGMTGAAQPANNNFWSTYVLVASPSQVKEAIKHENRVYLTQINTPEEVLIAGEPAACQRLIKTLGCNAFSAPFNHAIHCEAMHSEYDELVKLNTFPSQNIPNVVFYSASKYAPISLESGEIARSLATVLCEQLDFPRLVNRVYEDGAKIFIEAGAGSICSRLIDKILCDKEHLTVAFNRRGLDDHTSIIKALAKLTSHQVSLDLSPLYSQLQETQSQNKATIKTVTLGGKRIVDAILTEENRKIFQNVARTHQNLRLSNEEITNYPQVASNILANTKPEKVTIKNGISHSLEPREQLQFSASTTTTKQIPQFPASPPQKFADISMTDSHKSQYQKLNANNSRVTKEHAAFLKARQESSKQLSEIIQLQLACAENLLTE